MKRIDEQLINEYDGNKYYVRVNPRVQKFGQSTGWEGVNFNEPGPHMGSRGDCVIRALALATGLSYINVARKLRVQLDDKNDVPGVFEGYAWEDVLKFFHQTYKISDERMFGELLKTRLHKTQITVKEFAQTVSRHRDFKNKYLIIHCADPNNHWSSHAVFVKNGRYYDAWDCGDWIVRDVFDATNERRPTAYDFRNIVQIRRGTKKRYFANREPMEINNMKTNDMKNSIFEKQVSVGTLAQILKEDIQNDNAVHEMRSFFLKECRHQLMEEGEIPALKTFDHVSREEYRAIWAELHKKYWPDADSNGPILGIDTRKGQHVAAKFIKELNDKLSSIHVKNGGELSPEHTAYAQQLNKLTNDTGKSWMQDFLTGFKMTFDEKWTIIMKYAKTAGIAALIFGIVFLVIYGVRQAIEMIRTIKKTRRESRDGSQVIMTIPFKNDDQMQEFFSVIKKKMSKYVEIESIDGTNVTISCDQKYVLSHMGEIKRVINEIKLSRDKRPPAAAAAQKMAAESAIRTMTFENLKRLVCEQ